MKEGVLTHKEKIASKLEAVVKPGSFAGETAGEMEEVVLIPKRKIDIKLEAKGQEAKWIEIAGCGMVDPAVFEAVSSKRGDSLFAPDEVTGFAFGFGLDRLAMILHGITDIRHLIENDFILFLCQSNSY